ncbi:PilW family protein [Acidithiobacillus sp. AMEEHan]|uniref:PilW family protein n=1 Tax=Acidithiobacillus sp. AMEEHan TaxID=2994951 RepID=UPI0027E5A643|nr:PilW family protein [Acidithiobacillus sp. AMEEHan]
MELLVALVVVGLLSTAVFSFFLRTSQGVSQQSANGEMWQRGRNAMAIMRQAIESAGYGLPSYSQCPNGVVGINSTSAQGGALVAITASVQSYDTSLTAQGGTAPYSFSTVIGGGSLGGAPATTVVGYSGNSSGSSENINVTNTQLLNPCDIALIVPQGGGTCLMGQITNITKGSSNKVGFNSGSSCGLQLNPTQIFAALPNTPTAPSISGANLYDLGSQHFLFTQFQIMENPAGNTPTLYMTQYTGSQATAPTPQALASGVVVLQMQYGLTSGMSTSVSAWMSPTAYNQSIANGTNPGTIVAVQLAMLIRSTQYLPNSLSPASFDVLGQTYTVPTSGGPGCLQGNCRHYAYHLFQSIIPVRNGIWGSE